MYVVKLFQRYLEKEMSNIFFYRASTGTGTATDLMEVFRDDVLPLINQIQVLPTVTNRLLQVQHLFDLEDFVDDSLTGGGGFGGVNAMPSFVALNYTLRLDTRAVRPGKKRFSGLPEEVISLGVIGDAGMLTKVNALRAQLGAVLVGVGASYTPCVVKRVLVEGGEGEEDTYRLPVTIGELVYGNVTTVLVNTTVTTQNSRKG